MENGKIELVYFNDETYERKYLNSIEDFEEKEDFRAWVNIKDDDLDKYLKDLKKVFKVHELVLEDIFQGSKRTKVERFENFDFIVIHPVKAGDEDEELISFDELFMLVSDSVLITLNYCIKKDIMKKLYINMKNTHNSMRKLEFTILESIVDSYYDTFSKVERKVDEIDLNLVKKNDYDIISDLHLMRRNVIYMNKYVTPFKNIIKYIYNMDVNTSNNEIKYYYRDLNDDMDDIIESIGVYKDLISNIIETVNNKVSDKTNDITKILTIWSTIFLPVTFLSSVYGMNFKHMNGLEWKFAYPFFWIISIIIIIFLIIYFKRKKWF